MLTIDNDEGDDRIKGRPLFFRQKNKDITTGANITDMFFLVFLCLHQR